jgi:hypothetical protein
MALADRGGSSLGARQSLTLGRRESVTMAAILVIDDHLDGASVSDKLART